MQKVKTQKACQNLIGQIHKLFTKTNMKQIQVKRALTPIGALKQMGN
jgi:arginine decarboxylase-like protein